MVQQIKWKWNNEKKTCKVSESTKIIITPNQIVFCFEFAFDKKK